MAQVNNPNVKKDDSVNTVLAGLQLYSGIKDLSSRNAMANASMTSSVDLTEAMRRKFEEMNQSNASQRDSKWPK